MLRPRAASAASRRLRDTTLELFDSLSDDQLELEALPDWTVADVFRHLADSDRASVLGYHLREFLPTKDLDDFERMNDRNLERLRAADRATLRRELATWGPRLATVIGLIPSPLARVPVPTMFGRLPLGWLAGLRPYDEWVHQWDILQALGRDEPVMDIGLQDVLAEFLLRAQPALPLKTLDLAQGVVAVAVEQGPVWRFDLARHQFGAQVTARPTVTVHLDVPTLCLLAADRIGWKDLEQSGRLTIDGDDRDAAEAFLGVVRVV